MKRKIFTRVLKSLFILLFVLGIGKVGWGEDILTFPFSTNGTASATSVIVANRTSTVTGVNITTGTITGNFYNASAWATTGTPNDYWTTSNFISTGYWHVAVTGSIKAANGGPKSFKIQANINDGAWSDIGTVTLVTVNTPVSYSFSLPSEFDNKTNIKIRWMQNTTLTFSGSVTSGGVASLGGVSIQADQFIAPTSQAKFINIVSVTPTTITINCAAGAGNRRIIKIKSGSDTWHDPVDDVAQNANVNYLTYGSGDQVVYNGTGTSVTVNVSDAHNIYDFKVYDYNILDAMTRFCLLDATFNSNPKLCALESIHTPTHTNIKLATAYLGATIDNSSGIIAARGIYWSTSPNVDDITGYQATDIDAATGTYSFETSGLPRSTNIYYKGYVTNESGTIMSEESSFNNTPVFTGTGTWETAARWNVQQVPGETGDVPYAAGDGNYDNPTIDGICTLTDHNGVNNLTINSSRILNLDPAINLTVNGTLTNNGGTAGLKLLSSSAGTGSLMHNTNNVDATVQRYIAGSDLLTAKKYHLVSVPITGSLYLSGVWLDSYLFTYLQGNDTWYNWDDPVINELDTHTGAMVYYPNWGSTTSKTYNITGKLNNDSYTPSITYNFNGYNLIPNPYPSAIDWDLVTKTGVDNAIWIFNPKDGFTNYDSYIDGVSSGDVTNIIPEGQAFFVKATGSGLTFNNDIRLHEQTIGFFKKSSSQISNVLNLKIAGNGGGDGIAVRFVDDATTGYDKKYDAAKFYGDKTIPQLSSYTASDPNLLSITGLPAGQSSTIVPLHLDMDFTGPLTFTAKGMESFNETSIELEDKQLTKLIDLRVNPVYTFDHTNTDAIDRFVLHFSSIMLGTSKPDAKLLSKVTVTNHEIYLQYAATANGKLIATVYDLQGRVINQVKLSGKGNDHLSIPASGAFLVKLNLPSGVETHKIVVL
jgi:hypothetical protein